MAKSKLPRHKKSAQPISKRVSVRPVVNEQGRQECNFRVGTSEDGLVVMQFPQKIDVIAFAPDQAVQLARLIVHHAAQANVPSKSGILLPPGTQV